MGKSECKNLLISIIVPIYKVEKYVNKCVDSLILQTYSNIEIILVDDGSPDNCGAICDCYQEMDKRIRVIHKCNGGLSDARNAGIGVAKGEYIAFVDSDDYVTEHFIEKLYNAIKQQNADVAICSFKLIDETAKELKEEIVSDEETIVSGHQLLREVLTPYGGKYVVAWNKLYKRKLFETLRFEKGMLYEDEYINFLLFWNCERVVLIPDILYLYLQRGDSIQGTNITLEKLKMKRGFHLQRIEFYKNKKSESLYQRSVQMYCNWLVSCFLSKETRLVLEPEYIELLQHDIRKYNRMLLTSKQSCVAEKIQNLIGCFSLAGAGKIKSIIQRI